MTFINKTILDRIIDNIVENVLHRHNEAKKKNKEVPKQETHYDILGVKRTASQEEIKKAYRSLSRKHHPDLGGDKDDFIRIKEAYEILSDKKRRKRYNAALAITRGDPISDLPEEPSGLRPNDLVIITGRGSHTGAQALVVNVNTHGAATVVTLPQGVRVTVDKKHLHKVGSRATSQPPGRSRSRRSVVNPVGKQASKQASDFSPGDVVKVSTRFADDRLLWKVIDTTSTTGRVEIYHSAGGISYERPNNLSKVSTSITGKDGYDHDQIGHIFVGSSVYSPTLNMRGKITGFGKNPGGIVARLDGPDGSKAEVLVSELGRPSAKQQNATKINIPNRGDLISVNFKGGGGATGAFDHIDHSRQVLVFGDGNTVALHLIKDIGTYKGTYKP